MLTDLTIMLTIMFSTSTMRTIIYDTQYTHIIVHYTATLLTPLRNLGVSFVAGH